LLDLCRCNAREALDVSKDTEGVRLTRRRTSFSASDPSAAGAPWPSPTSSFTITLPLPWELPPSCASTADDACPVLGSQAPGLKGAAVPEIEGSDGWTE
jgi:hypothetical protein